MERIAANPQCSAGNLFVEFEAKNRAKAKARPDLAVSYAYAAVEFRKAFNLHVGECAQCLRQEQSEGRAA